MGSSFEGGGGAADFLANTGVSMMSKSRRKLSSIDSRRTDVGGSDDGDGDGGEEEIRDKRVFFFFLKYTLSLPTLLKINE